MNSNVTVARSPVLRIPCGWSMLIIRTVWRIAWIRNDTFACNEYQGSDHIDTSSNLLHSEAWPIEGESTRQSYW